MHISYTLKAAGIFRSATEPADTFARNLRSGSVTTEQAEVIAVQIHAMGGGCKDALQPFQELRINGVQATLARPVS